MDDMLRKALRKTRELRNQVENVLLGDDGDIWEKELKNFLAKRPCWVKDVKGVESIFKDPSLLSIDRSTPFNLAKYLDGSWKVEEQDDRSLALTEIDLNQVRFEDMLKSGEPSVKGEEKLNRLKQAGHIRLDAKVFQTLWEKQHLIPESWKEKINGNTRFVYFDGTILRHSGGGRYVLYLYWFGGQWSWDYSWLGYVWCADSPSAVLASTQG